MDDLGQRSQTVGSARGIAVGREITCHSSQLHKQSAILIQMHCINQAVGINYTLITEVPPSGY